MPTTPTTPTTYDVAVSQLLNDGHHVHAADCADLTRGKYTRTRVEFSTMKVTCERDLITEFFSDFLADDPDMTWQSWTGELVIFPCAQDLPRDVPVIAETTPAYVLMGSNVWAQGATLSAAKTEFRKRGARLSDGYALWTFADGDDFHGVDQMGRIHFTAGFEPSYEEFAPRKSARR